MKYRIAIITVTAVLSMVGCSPEWVELEHYTLRAFANTAATRGSLSGFVFMVTGSFEEKDYFLAYLESPNGAIRMKRFESTSVVIYEFDDTEREPTATKLRLRGSIHAGEIGWRFNIPAGSIKPVINLTQGFE